jgi:glucose dehydrogenase
VASGDLLLVASEEGSLYAFDRATGSKVWEYSGGQPLRTPPAATARAIYFHNAYGFHALDRKGSLKWKIDSGPTCLLVERGDRVWLRDKHGMVYIVNDKTGAIESTVDLSGWFLVPNSDDGTFYAVSPDGLVFAYTERLKLQ